MCFAQHGVYTDTHIKGWYSFSLKSMFGSAANKYSNHTYLKQI